MATQLPANPFPGMNPYLEDSGLWPDVHNSVILGLRTFLARRLRPEYRVATQERVYIMEEPVGYGTSNPDVRIPDAVVISTAAEPTGAAHRTMPEPSPDAIAVGLPTTELVKERYIEVRRIKDGRVVAVIELLSPTNKVRDGRREYLAKRATVLYSETHLVEIDLLRQGEPMPMVGDVPASDYRILVADARRKEPVADLYSFGIRRPIPNFIMPLANDAEGIAVDLNNVVNSVYSDGSFDLDINYQQDPEPPLSDDDRVWLDQLLREQGLRKTTR